MPRWLWFPQEMSISGPGCRTLVQSMFYGEATAAAEMCAIVGDAACHTEFSGEAVKWQRRVLRYNWVVPQAVEHRPNPTTRIGFVPQAVEPCNSVVRHPAVRAPAAPSDPGSPAYPTPTSAGRLCCGEPQQILLRPEEMCDGVVRVPRSGHLQLDCVCRPVQEQHPLPLHHSGDQP